MQSWSMPALPLSRAFFVEKHRKKQNVRLLTETTCRIIEVVFIQIIIMLLTKGRQTK